MSQSFLHIIELKQTRTYSMGGNVYPCNAGTATQHFNSGEEKLSFRLNENSPLWKQIYCSTSAPLFVVMWVNGF